MIEGINNQVNKEKLAIVVVGYNKLVGLNRLLNALNEAAYDTEDIPLVLSIDASGNEDVYKAVRNFNWQHGTKYVNIEKQRLGLKDHIFQCASLTKYFRGVVILEDDILVSPYFYNYCIHTLNKYGMDDNVAGIALFSNEYEGFRGLPLQHVHSGHDVFAWQSVCSWGEIWNERMWNSFTEWLGKWDGDFGAIDMTRNIKEWSRAWSKFVYAYIIQNNKYFIFPYEPVTTNFNDAGGEHGGGEKSLFQVSLLQGKRDYNLSDFKELTKYDVYCQNMSIPEWLGIDSSDITIDFYGHKDTYKGHYILTPFKLPLKKLKGFSLSMRPWELNIKYGIEGNDITLYYREDAKETVAPPERTFSTAIANYYLRGFNFNLLIKYVWYRIIMRLKH